MAKHPSRFARPSRLSALGQFAFATAVGLVLGCGSVQSTPETPAASNATALTANNPLVLAWDGPHGGVPKFADVQIAHFKPALAWGMDEFRAELRTIVDNPAAPTFENTIEPLERAGGASHRVTTLYHIWESTLNTEAFQAIAREMAPVLAAFEDEIIQNQSLFARIAEVHAHPDAGWTAEQSRLVWRTHTQFVLAGAQLGTEDKARLAEINKELATRFTSFRQNLLHDEEHYVLALKDESELAGLPKSFRAEAQAAAEARGLSGQWAILNTRSSAQPFLTFSNRRDLREKVFQNFVGRGDNGDEHDNNQLVSEVLELRAERAKLLGYESHAHWRLQDSMAKTPEATLKLMRAVWSPAVARVREEVADMQAIVDREEGQFRIEPWDYRYYAEKVRKEKYDLDETAIKPYLQLEKLREGMFWVAGQLFGFQFQPAPEIPVYHPDVRVWTVSNSDGKHVGLWYFDPYARKGKHSGAWMNSYRQQQRLDGEVTALVSNNSNFLKPAEGEIALVSWDNARTLFHEFGHALHGLSSNVRYPSLSGTAVARDYVEFPSQLLEHWMLTKEVLNKFALHFETGDPLPASLVEKIERARHFNQGFQTVEYLSTALVDMKLHLAADTKIDAAAFEKETLAELGMPREIVMRHRIPQLGHVFSGDAYAAGYYSYLWSDTLTADAFEAFKEAKGPYDPAVALRLHKHVFSVGNTVDPAEGYRSFRGKDPGIAPLMRKRGFPVPAE